MNLCRKYYEYAGCINLYDNNFKYDEYKELSAIYSKRFLSDDIRFKQLRIFEDVIELTIAYKKPFNKPTFKKFKSICEFGRSIQLENKIVQTNNSRYL